MAFSVVQECLSFRIVKTTLILTFFFIRNPHSAHARTHFHNILSVFLSLSFSCKTCRGIPLKIKKLTRVISKNVVHTQEYIFVFVFYSNENVSSLLFYFVREKKRLTQLEVSTTVLVGTAPYQQDFFYWSSDRQSALLFLPPLPHMTVVQCTFFLFLDII